jgi:fatty acid desaturase
VPHRRRIMADSKAAPRVTHSSTLPREFHGATNDSRSEAADVTVASIDADKEMIINRRVYDVSSFVKRHPGGSVIKFQLGADASDAYNNFHVRSKKADKMLHSLPSRPAEAGYAQDEISRDFEKLRLELKAEGFFEPNLVHVAFRCVEVLAMYWAGVQLIWSGYWFLGAIVAGLAQGRCGWLQHEGGHYSLTGNIKIDRHLQMAIYGLGCGMSGCYWRNQHNKHHATPQKLGTDPDLQTMPLVAFHKIIGAKARGKGRAWLAWQAPLFFGGVICSLVSFGWQFVLHPNHALRVHNHLELAYMGLRYVLWHLAFGHLGLLGSLRLYAFYVGVGGTYIFTNFAVSHTHKDVVPPTKHISWALYSANHTTNCTDGPLVNWWMAYLNFQIEHHLFPSMPQYNHPKIAPRVRALFEKHGVEYDVRSYLECFRVTYVNLLAVGNPEHSYHEHTH